MALALYRTYRPGRFADVVGQEHVTAPLVRAIEKNRVHHAYLFSGPRGCGKTSSARILARSLNCAAGPTPEPCGQCQSCQELAPNGPGSLDVVELDAATHGLVDDARDLRERAHFAPVASRYKIYIIDEAHQLGPGAANALLKIIEEPPPHVRFVFATTSPDKILPTIRSRTHHYPFRLVPARLLQQHLAWVCDQEQVAADATALDLVARAGAGSVRDALSVLGQLMAGAGDDGVTYALAYDQLGFTDAAMLDSVVTSLATSDAAGIFHAVDRVVESGHDPRRFLTDLLERLRDLLLLQTVPDALDSGLVSAPDDQAGRMLEQARAFGRADLVRCAHVADEGVLAMRGATPTRLQLELVCSRLLLPGSESGVGDLHARVDRMERQIQAMSGTAAAPPSAHGTRPPDPAGGADGSSTRSRPTRTRGVSGSDEAVATPLRDAEPTGPAAATSAQPAQAVAEPAQAVAEPAQAVAEPAAAGGIAEVRRAWPEVLERLRELRKTPWTFVKDNTEPIDVSDGVLVLGVGNARLRDTLAARDDYVAYLHQAVTEVLGRSLRIEAVVQPGPGGADRPASSLPAATRAPRAVAPDRRAERTPPPAPRADDRTEPEADPDVAPDDDVVDEVSGTDLLSRELGARIIDVVDES